MPSGADLAHLEEVVALAERGLYTTAPNPRVGCLIVRDGVVLGRGWHQWWGEAHAEVRALQDAGGDVAGATVYVSLEPCCIRGMTPPCVDALVASKVRRVVVGALDPDPRVNGKGVRQLQKAGIAVEVAQHEAAQALNAPLRHRLVSGRPWVRIKMAGSLDGRAAMASGQSQWITGPAARLDGQHWRARSCAVLTGIGTLLADDPRLNVRDRRFAADGRLRQPLRVVVDSRLRAPGEARLFKASGPILMAHAIPLPDATVFRASGPVLMAYPPPAAEGPVQGETTADFWTQAAALGFSSRPVQTECTPYTGGQARSGRRRHRQVVRSDRLVQTDAGRMDAETRQHQQAVRPAQDVRSGAGLVDLRGLLELLAAKPCNEVLVEAGPTLTGAFIAAGLWDEILLYLAPKLLGASARPLFDFALEHLEQAVRGRILDTKAFGADLRVRLARA